MKINEIFNNRSVDDLRMGDELPFNEVEDLIIYMKNDPDFYRQSLYPELLNVQNCVQDGKKYNKKNMIPIVDSAVESYLKKYEINRLPEEFLLNSDKKECISKILNDEIENFRNKVY